MVYVWAIYAHLREVLGTPESHTRCVKSRELLLENISHGFEDSPLDQTPYLAKWQVGQRRQTAMSSDPIPSLETANEVCGEGVVDWLNLARTSRAFTSYRIAHLDFRSQRVTPYSSTNPSSLEYVAEYSVRANDWSDQCHDNVPPTSTYTNLDILHAPPLPSSSKKRKVEAVHFGDHTCMFR
jgi:hypothetical protein